MTVGPLNPQVPTPAAPAAPPASPRDPGAEVRDSYAPGSTPGAPAAWARRDPARARELGLPEDTPFVQDLPATPGGTFPPPPPALPRPVLLVHGLSKQGSFWFNLRNYLASNPDNRPGPDFHVDREAGFVEEVRKDPGARVFSISLSNPRGSYRDLAPELTRCLEVLRRETGAAEVDVVAHSMGGLVTREHLDGPEDGIHRFIMLATPNHGSLEADVALATDRLRLYRHYPDGTTKVLQDIGLDESFLGHENNPHLHGLNERWPEQRAKVEPVIITGAGIPTPDWNLALFSTGDGMVTARSAWMPDTEYYVAAPPQSQTDRLFSLQYNHGQIQEQPAVAHLVGQLLARS